MERLQVNPLYRDWLAQQGLRRAEDFLRLSGVIYCGHPDRHVAHVMVGEGDMTLSAFLKKEHRVPLKDRLRNALAGFGFVSKSLREAHTLREIASASIGCPEVIAAGEHKNRAFLLVREVQGGLDLRNHLAQIGDRERQELAAALGAAVADMHERGIFHGDMFSKHIIVQRDSRFVFLDWQRAQHRRTDSRQQRLHDLASLDATLADNLCTPRDRLAFLKSYVSPTRERGSDGRFPSLARRANVAQIACAIRQRSRRLLRKRYIREMRQPPLKPGTQNLIWLDGERLCVTQEFLRGDRRTACHYVHRNESRFWHWLSRRLRGRPFTSKAFAMAAMLFRLQRFGVPTPKLLAVGHEFPLPWRSRSFAVLENVAVQPFDEWCRQNRDAGLERKLREQAAATLDRIHEAGYALEINDDPYGGFGVCTYERTPTIILHNLDVLRRIGRGKT